MIAALAIACGALALLAATLVINALRFRSRQVEVPAAEGIAVDAGRCASNLARALSIATVSFDEVERVDIAAFASFHVFLSETYPRVHRALKREVVGGHSLLYTWAGSDPALPPTLLMAHLDVVPAGSDSEGDWTHPPFAGEIADGFVWGRGALDDKASLIGILEAVEALLAEGYAPRRSVLLAFGHDEELGGWRGAAALAALLEERGVRAALVLDESGVITQGIVPRIDKPVALIGIAEKGFVTLQLEVRQDGGHSSMPPPRTAIGILGAAVDRLEGHPFPVQLTRIAEHQFNFLGPEMPLLKRLTLANRWLLSSLVRRKLEQKPTTAAALRTTLAATMISGGEKENVLPQRAQALVNLRVLPGETEQSVLEHVNRAVADPRVTVRLGGMQPRFSTVIADPEAAVFGTLVRTIRELFPGTLVAPYLVLGATDAFHYGRISDCLLRFLPLRVTEEDLKRIHGTDERIAVDNFAEVVRFYAQLIRNMDPVDVGSGS